MTSFVLSATDQGSDSAHPLLVDVNRAAAMCAVSPEHFRRMADSGRAPQPLKLGTSTRWRLAEIVDWVDAGCPDRRRAVDEARGQR